MKDFLDLDKSAKEAKKEIGEQDTYRKGTEPNKTIGMRESDYEKVRLYSFKNHKTMINVLHDMVNSYLKDNQ